MQHLVHFLLLAPLAHRLQQQQHIPQQLLVLPR
jgi:hypothetical protein